MTNEQILEGNKLICAFMGAKLVRDDLYDYGETNNAPTEFSSTQWNLPYMQYYSNWFWLIPVVEKILNLKDTFAQPRQEVINSISPNIEATYISVVEFIKWYNENK